MTPFGRAPPLPRALLSPCLLEAPIGTSVLRACAGAWGGGGRGQPCARVGRWRTAVELKPSSGANPRGQGLPGGQSDCHGHPFVEPCSGTRALTHGGAGLRERGNDTGRSTGRSGRQNAATRRNMRREDRVTVQAPVKEQPPDGMSHRGGYVWGRTPPPSSGPRNLRQWGRQLFSMGPSVGEAAGAE